MKFRIHRNSGTIVCFVNNDAKGFAIKVNINKHAGIMRYWDVEFMQDWIDLD